VARIGPYAAGGLALLFVWLRLRARRGLGPTRKRRGPDLGPDPALREEYRRFLARVHAQCGIDRGAAETDEELLARLDAAPVEFREEARAFIAQYHRARFGASGDP
jgi:hypothetical protein